jgi:hypothetical protein
VDRENPTELGGAALTERVQRLRASFDASPWAGPVLAERYDPTQPGRLRFEWEFADRPVGSF